MLVIPLFCGPLPATELVDRAADHATVWLQMRLVDLARRGVMFGHQDALAYGVHWRYEPGRSDVSEACGDFPAVFGWDLGELELGRPANLDGVPFVSMQQWIRDVHRRGGVSTVSWHMVNPITERNSWDTTRAVAEILPGGVQHRKFKAWLDRFVEFVQGLEVDGQRVPLVFRPWHEASGDWFWWGRRHCTREEYTALWRFTVQYLQQRGVHHLLYAFSPDVFESEEQYLDRYPGDEWVDVLGFDDYRSVRTADAANRNQLAQRIETVVGLARARGKVAAFTETGFEGIPTADWFTGMLLPAIRQGAPGGGLSWVLVWRNAYSGEKPGHHFAPFAGHPSAPDCERFRLEPDVLFLGEISNPGP